MPTLTKLQVGYASSDPTGLFHDPSAYAECPYCGKRLNPYGNIGTHSVKHPNGHQIAYYRTHLSCATEALPTEVEGLDRAAVALLDEANEAARTRAHLTRH